jgi:hypothetical protein
MNKGDVSFFTSIIVIVWLSMENWILAKVLIKASLDHRQVQKNKILVFLLRNAFTLYSKSVICSVFLLQTSRFQHLFCS